MGTNFYLHQKKDCECCGRPFEPLHIGKSSVGWAFSLHVIPEKGITTLYDWIKLFIADGSYIRNQYRGTVSVDEMLCCIVNRNLDVQRHYVDGIHCVRRGEGTWDYIAGEFS